jgi:hypothetical protein
MGFGLVKTEGVSTWRHKSEDYNLLVGLLFLPNYVINEKRRLKMIIQKLFFWYMLLYAGPTFF